MESLPKTGSQFVFGACGLKENDVVWRTLPNGKIEIRYTFQLFQEGPKGYVHGGASAALMDEALGIAVWESGFHGATVHLELNYRKPIPLGEEVRVETWVTSGGNHSRNAEGIIYRSDGSIAVEGKGKFALAPQLFGASS